MWSLTIEQAWHCIFHFSLFYFKDKSNK
jgi:hypothetical protein